MPFRCPLQIQGVNLLDDFSGLLVHNKLVLVLGVFDIAIGSKGADILAAAPLVVKNLSDFLRGLIAVLIVHNICDWSDDTGNAVRVTVAVHIFSQTDPERGYAFFSW